MPYASDPRLVVLENIRVPAWVFDPEKLTILWANSSALKFWNANTKEELYAREYSSDISTSVRKHLLQTKKDCLTTGKTVSENWTLYPEGVPQTSEAVLSAIEFEDNRSALLIHIIYERKDETSDTLRSAQALMHTSAMISLYDEDFSLLYSNPAARSQATIANESLNQKIGNDCILKDITNLLTMIGSYDTEMEVKTKKGCVWHSMNFQRSPDPVTGKNAILLSAIDISDRKKAQQEAVTLAYTDSLTSLPNRIAVLEYLNRLCANTTEKFGLFFLDLDRFKVVNDSLGHLTGDNLLVEVGIRLGKIMENREGLVSRLGGDEFVLVVEELEGREGLSQFAEEILHALGKDFRIAGHNISTLPSIGICRAPTDGDNPTTLMQHADVAMYAAKATKSGYCFFDTTMNQHAEKRLELESDLATAIKENQFQLYYQPKISTKDYSITGMEALIRWVHPSKGIISPVEFIPIAEETGIINKIGDWAILEAMEQQKNWMVMGYPVVVSVNVSAVQFASGNLVDNIKAATKATACEPSLVEFEITESLLLGDSSSITDILSSLSNIGFRISLDDFGTGYSNLAYLSKYPLNCLKIDRQFIMDTEQTAILEMVINMGRALGLKVVAEGVETIEQINLLRKNRCDELQGYYFSKPLPKALATDYIVNYTAPICQEDQLAQRLENAA